MNPAWIHLPPHPTYSELALYFLSLNLRDRRLVDQYHSCVTSFDMLEQLERMNPREIQYLARLNPKLAQLTVNLTGLESGMRVIEQLKSEQQNIVWLIKNGANKALITQVYPSVNESELKEMIYFLSDADKPRLGRVPGIQGELQTRVEQVWYEIGQKYPQADLLEKLRHLKTAFPNHDLARLNAALRQS